jgi:ribosomal protein S8
MTNFVFGDFVSNLNNGRRQHLVSINVRNTSLVKEVLALMMQLGLLRSINILDNRHIEVFFKYYQRRCVFSNIKLISIPSRRVYIDLVKLAKLKDKSNCSIYILSTNKGIKTDFECLFDKVSGELLLKIEL